MASPAQNFDIQIGPLNDAGELAVRVIGSPAGENQNPIYATLPRDNLDNLLRYFKFLVAEESDMQELGKLLFDFLFPARVKELFDRSLPTDEHGSLRIRLMWDNLDIMSELGQIPWEYLFDGGEFLGLKRPLSIVRYLRSKAPTPLQIPRPLRVLGVSAAPSSLPHLDIDRELDLLELALGDAIHNQAVSYQKLENGTRQQLLDAIRTFQPHVLHYAGHGLKGGTSGKLVLCTAAGEADEVAAEELRALLDHGPVRLAILNACETAAQPVAGETLGSPMQSVAGLLIQAGLPAVIGMQYKIPDDIALEFMKLLYNEIARGTPLDRAVTEARIGLSFTQINKTYWGLPALYLRVNDGRIFRDRSDDSPIHQHAPANVFAVLTDLIRIPAVHDFVLNFQKDLELVRKKIKIINFFKKMHDDIQTMETIYVLLVDDFARLPTDNEAWDNLFLNDLELQDIIASLYERAQNPPAQVEIGPWIELLNKSGRLIADSIEDRDVTGLDRGLQTLFRALEKSLPRINGWLVINAQNLPLTELVSNLKSIHQKMKKISGIDINLFRQFLAGIKGFELLADELPQLISVHNRWQDFDEDLRRVHANLNEDLFELELSWPDLQQKSKILYTREDGRWATSLSTISDMVTRSIKSESQKPILTVINTFKKYRGQAVKRFRDIDYELLTLCHRLEKEGEPIDVLLETLQ